jgi:hypothetical protein
MHTGIHTVPADTYHADQIDDERRRVGRPPRPAMERFLGHFIPEPNTGCWLWTSGVDRDGYAKFFEGRGLEQYGHRYAYKQFVGPIPEGLILDHLCRVRHCVNPTHLEPVTNRENIMRGRRPLGERTHCPRGHPFNDKNTYFPSHGGRKCRACHAEHERRRRVERKAA